MANQCGGEGLSAQVAHGPLPMMLMGCVPDKASIACLVKDVCVDAADKADVAYVTLLLFMVLPAASGAALRSSDAQYVHSPTPHVCFTAM